MTLERLNQYFNTLDKYGWVINYVVDGRKRDIHTYGLIEKFGHRELQIVLPIKPSIAKQIIWIMVRQIEMGKRFEPGKCYAGILEGSKIRICRIPSDDSMLRVILPDNNGHLHKECLEGVFKDQYVGL